ncbi:MULTISPECIES: autotransporter outer membrane beta-barrel domain-containing protein [unclassified Afipia]|uniref:autotransporter outer membrane beta-barrel domain-containing protein n=1 Tax=unclassified Afipia TaxID=2642050 RepID=UPI000411782A|nr:MULTISPECIES: autotransporter outer membrane beta-barrel domain-containing protein [unclassified Afipia]
MTLSASMGRKKLLHVTVAGVALCTASSASAQFIPPTPGVTDNNSQLSVNAAQFDLGSSFLQRLGREATYGYAARDNSGGGGASQSTAEPQYRTWAETYGIRARTAAQGTFVGDKRGTLGVVGGIGATVAPGLNVGFSADQSQTWIDVPLALQSATLGMTQLGVNASYLNGPWTVAMAAVHGFARISSIRATPLGSAYANYRGSIDGVLGELNYTYAFGQSRIVPKVALEYVSARTDRFSESGGFLPVTVADGHGERARVLAGAEFGHYWIVGQQAIDVSVYGKFVDNFTQNIGTVQVSLGNNAIGVAGIRESRNGADAGAATSWILSNTARLYANYDGRFRSGFESHQGTVGVELKW